MFKIIRYGALLPSYRKFFLCQHVDFSTISRISTLMLEKGVYYCRVVTALPTPKLAGQAGGSSLISMSSFSSSSEGSILIQFAQATREVGFQWSRRKDNIEIKHLNSTKFELERVSSSRNRISCSN